MSAQGRRVLPWAAAALTVGILTGFAFGQDGTPPIAAQDTEPSTPPVVAQELESGAPSPSVHATEAAATQGPSPPSSASPLPCIGAPIVSPDPHTAVIGVSDVGAEQLAEVMGVQSLARPFNAIQDEQSQAALRTEALQEARRGPVVLVLWRSSGSFQTSLAAEVLGASPGSAVVVVDSGGDLSASTLAGYPTTAIAVPAPGDGPEGSRAWALALQSVLNGETSCSGG